MPYIKQVKSKTIPQALLPIFLPREHHPIEQKHIIKPNFKDCGQKVPTATWHPRLGIHPSRPLTLPAKHHTRRYRTWCAIQPGAHREFRAPMQSSHLAFGGIFQWLQPRRSVVSNLCDPMDCCAPCFPVHHQLPELSQTHVRQVGNDSQTSHPLSSPFPPAFNLLEEY